MKGSVEAKAFANLVARVCEAASQVHGLKSKTGMWLELRDGKITGRATDYEVLLEARAEATVGAPGARLVPARELLAIAKATLDKTQKDLRVVLDATKEETKLSLQVGRSNYRLAIQPGETPFEPFVKPELTAALRVSTWIRLLNVLLPACGRDTAKPALCGLHLKLGEEHDLVAMASDGVRFVEMQHDLLEGERLPFRELGTIPTRMLEEMPRLLKGRALDDLLEMTLDRSVTVYFEDAVLSSPVLASKFPDFSNAFPKAPFKMVWVGRDKALALAIRHACAVVSGDAGAVQTRLVFEGDGSCKASCASFGVADAEEVIEGRLEEGSGLRVVLNGVAVADILKAVGSVIPPMRISIGDERMPVLFQALPTLRAILMPARE